MKVRILSGSQAGAVVELSRVEAESAIATGYAELYVEPAPVVEEPKPAKPARAPEKFEKKPAKR